MLSMSELSVVKEVLNILSAPILAYGVWLLSDIRTQLVKLNTRVTTLEQWTESHEKLDDERTILIRKSIDDCVNINVKHA